MKEAECSMTSGMIQVVVFGSGPELNADAQEFLCRLEDHSEINLLAVFCQSPGQTVRAVFLDLWKRRQWLAFPLFVFWLVSKSIRYLHQQRQERACSHKLSKIANRIHFVTDIHAPAVLEQVRMLHPDLGLIYGSPILKPELFELPRLGTLGIHHGKVPEYRGNKTTFWAMYNDEPFAGVTIQKVNRGLDTGSIVKEGQVPAGLRPYLTVFRELEALGIDLYIQAVLEVKHGCAEFRPQTGNKGKLYRNPKFTDFIKFWGRRLKKRLAKIETRYRTAV